MENRCTGVWPAVATPFQMDGNNVDTHVFIEHCQSLLHDGAHGISLLGTTGEANSLCLKERQHLLDSLIEAGVSADQLLPGTGCCALADTAALTTHAVRHNCAGVLLIPPFFYKPVSEEGLYDYVSELIMKVAAPSLKIYLYHIPQFSGIPWPLKVIERLLRDFPQHIAGVKDSTGDRANLHALITNFPSLSIFPASESLLLETMRLGGAGCISGSANVNIAAMRELYDNRNAPYADDLSERVKVRRGIFKRHPLIPAVKSVLARTTGHAAWAHVRPPLRSLPADAANAVAEDFFSATQSEASHG